MAALWKKNQATPNSVSKGNVSHSSSSMTGNALLAVPIPEFNVPPTMVLTDDTRAVLPENYQRKVFYDGTNFFIIYWYTYLKQIRYVASGDGINWTSPTVLRSLTVSPPPGGHVDVQYPSAGAYNVSIVYLDPSYYWYELAYRKTGQTLTQASISALAGATAQGGTIIASFGRGEDFWVFHRSSRLPIGYWATEQASTTQVPYGGATSGGAQILTYKTSSPYTLFVLAKGGDDKLYYALAKEDTTTFLTSFAAIETLTPGFSGWCAATEAQSKGYPEIIHIVYIKSTGELCYRKFENDTLGSETVLVASGVSSVVIATGYGGRVYVFYVRAGVIKLLKYNGVSWEAEQTLYSDHTYDNPAYLSCNQAVQDGEICLVWMEKLSSPYELWFCAIGD